MKQSRYDEAEVFFTQVLDIRRDAFGSNDLQVAMAINNLADAKRRQGKLDDAEHLYREALVIRRDLRGDLHGDTAMSQFLLAGLYVARGNLAQARLLHERALETRRKVLHEDHPDLARSRTALGILCLQLHDPEAAETMLLAAQRRHEKVLGRGHWRTRAACDELIKLYEQSGNPDESARWRAEKER